jgi:ring-1,2-phenylacetyl-CoA epoxidase subunit PaaC
VLYDHAEGLRWQALADSSIPEVVGVARRARREEAFHVAHADGVLRRVLVAGGDARDRVVAATARLLPVAATMWTSVDGETEAVATGVATSSSADLAERWWTEIKVLYEASGVVLDRPVAASGAGRTQRSAHFADLHAEIRLVIDLDPNARW